MADDNEIAITIIPDEVANVEGAAPVEKKEEADPKLDLMNQLKELETKNQEVERRRVEEEHRRLAAEQEAARHRQDAESARKAQTSSHLDTITTALSSAEQEAESAKRDLRTAREAGDITAEVDAADRLAKARATAMRLDEARQDIEAKIKAPLRREAPPPPADPVEAFAQSLSSKSAAWVRSHPEFVTTKGLKRLTAADAVAKADDLEPDTPEYFARVEEYLGLKKKPEPAMEQKPPIEAAQVKPKQSAAPPVAPGAAVSSNGGSQPSVQLTKREADAAQDGTLVWNWNDPNGKYKKGDPIGLQEMARRKMHGMKQGLYDRSFTEN